MKKKKEEQTLTPREREIKRLKAIIASKTASAAEKREAELDLDALFDEGDYFGDCGW